MIEDKRRQAVVGIIEQSGKYLFVKRSEYVVAAKGYWCPVSGGIEPGETQEEALQREAMEEVGLNLRAVKKVCEIPSHDNHSLLHFWTTEIISGEAKITSNEAVELRWVTLDEMKKLRPVFKEDIEIFESLGS